MKYIESRRTITIYTQVWLAGNEHPTTVANEFTIFLDKVTTVTPQHVPEDQVFLALTQKIACIKKFGDLELDLYVEHQGGWSRCMTLNLTDLQYAACNDILVAYTRGDEILGLDKDTVLKVLFELA